MLTIILIRNSIHSMYVCLCKGITDGALERAVADGARTFREVRNQLGVATQCGKCACLAKGIVDNAVAKTAVEDSLFYEAVNCLESVIPSKTYA